MPTLTNIVGYMYNAAGESLRSGTLSLRLQQDISSVDGTKIAPFSIAQSLLPFSPLTPYKTTYVGATGSTTYLYRVTAFDALGHECLPGGTVNCSLGNATLSTSNYIHLDWFAVPGAASYGVYGRNGTLTLLGTTTALFYEDKGAAAIGTALPTINLTGGYVNLHVAPTIGALPSGVGYFVEFDPDPTDTSQPARTKDGYWSNYWTVPSGGPFDVGSFPSANRGVPLQQLVLNGATGFGDLIRLGVATPTNKRILAGQAFTTPEIRYNDTTHVWELSHDGTTFEQITTPSTGDITNVIAGTGMSGGGTTGAVTLNLAPIVNAVVAGGAAIAYSKLALTNSILAADIVAAAGIPYSKLTLTGALVNADVASGAAIAYSKLSLGGSILNSDIVAAAGIPYSKLSLGTSIVNADIAAGAAIVYSKLSLTTSIVNGDVNASAAIAYSKLNLATSIVNADIAAGAAIAYSKLNLTTSIVNGDVNAAAAIAWTKIDKAGSSLADLATRSATDLSTGTVASALLPIAGTTTGTRGAVYADNSTIAVDGTGKISVLSAPVTTANGASWTFGSASELLTLSTSGTTTDTAANLLPANSIIESVVARVTTTITTATNWKLGDATTSGRFTAADAVMTAGETQVGLVHIDQTAAAGPRQTTAAKVRVTTTGTPGAGAIRITVFYRTLVAPTS